MGYKLDGDGEWTLYAETGWDPLLGRLHNVRVTVSDSRISEVETDVARQTEDLHIQGSLLIPALSNGHDHLKYHWPLRVGGDDFENSYDWIPELQERAVDAFLSRVDVSDLYWLGTYANLLSGASTVINHARMPAVVDPSAIPIRTAVNFRRELMIDASRNPVVWEHRMGDGAVAESQAAEREGSPFVVHVAEGTDASTMGEVRHLAERGALHSGCVLVHAVNIDDDEIGLLAAAGASVVWCPSSNLFLFDRTARVADLLAAGVNVLLGTDSPCSGSGFLRHELRLARDLLIEQADFGIEMASDAVLEMATSAFSTAFPAVQVGRLEPGYKADLALFHREQPNQVAVDVVTSRSPSFVSCNGRALLMPRAWFANGYVRRWPGATEAVTSPDGETVICGSPSDLVARMALVSGTEASFFPLARELDLVEDTSAHTRTGSE